MSALQPAGVAETSAPVESPAALETTRSRKPGSRRGMHVRRLLIAAGRARPRDCISHRGVAFGHKGPADRLTMFQEYLLFLVTLPGWAIVAKLLQALRPGRRADRSLDGRRPRRSVPSGDRRRVACLRRGLGFRRRKPGDDQAHHFLGRSGRLGDRRSCRRQSPRPTKAPLTCRTSSS